MRRIIAAMLIGLSVTGVFMQYSHRVSADLQNSVYRLHILANSDSEADQSLKIKVRDRVVKTLDRLVPEGTGLEATKKAVSENLPLLCRTASEEIAANGCEYPVTVRTGRFYFPTKDYEGIALPKGCYNGLQIIIGKGEGHNWWCVLYPNLCFTEGVVKMPDRSKEKLKQSLSEDEMRLISEPKRIDVKFKFKLLELFD